MKVVGIIKMVELARKGTTKQGTPYERHNVFFEGGGDVHIVEVFISLGGNMTAQEVLNRRGLVPNAIGEMEIKYSIDSYDGKWLRRCEYVGFRIPQQPTIASEPTVPQSADAEGKPFPSQSEVAEVMAEAAEVAESHIDPETGLPF